MQGSQEKKSVEKCPHINNRLDVQPAYVIKIDTNTEKKWERIHPSKNRWQHNRVLECITKMILWEDLRSDGNLQGLVFRVLAPNQNS